MPNALARRVQSRSVIRIDDLHMAVGGEATGQDASELAAQPLLHVPPWRLADHCEPVNEKVDAIMQNISETNTDNNPGKTLLLVDIDDLRAAFGGEAASQDTSELAAIPPTLMCPLW